MVTRRWPSVALLLAAVPSGSAAAPQDFSGAAGPFVVEDPWTDAGPLDPLPVALPGGAQQEVSTLALGPATRELLHALREPHLTLVVAAFRVHGGGGAAAEFLSGSDPFLPDEAPAVIRAALAGGHLVESGRVRTVVGAGWTVDLSDVRVARTLARRDLESAVDAVVGFPDAQASGAGLAVSAFVAPHADGRYAVSYHVVAAGRSADAVEQGCGGPFDAVDAPALSVQGVAGLAPGETVAAGGIGADGDGWLVTLGLRGGRQVRLPAALGGDWHALPLASLDFAREFAPVTESEAPERLAILHLPERVASWDPPPPGNPPTLAERVGALGVRVDEVVVGPAGVVFARARGDDGRRLHAAVRERLAACDTRCIEVAGGGEGNVRIPVLPGTAFRAFRGRVSLEFEGFSTQSGCHTCLLAVEELEPASTGIAVAGRLDEDGAVPFDLVARTVTERKRTDFDMRRSLPGHATLTHDPIWMDLRSERILRVRAVAPPAGCALPGGVSLRTGAPRGAGSAIVEVNGEPVPLAPGGVARFSRLVRTQHVTRWDSWGSCGMTTRSPLPEWVEEGVEAAVRLDRDGASIDVAAVAHGPASTILDSFDPQDGAVEILRLPRLALRTTLPLAAVTRVAWGEDLELTVGETGSLRPPLLRTANVAAVGRECGFRFREGAAVQFDAGAYTRLPAQLDHYLSNHSSGEVFTETVLVPDGIEVVLLPAADGVSDGGLVARSEPTLQPFELRKSQEPGRPDVASALLLPSLSVRSFRFTVPEGRALRRDLAAEPFPVRVQVLPAQ